MNNLQISERLIKAGFTGLYSPTGECACEIRDLAPCGEDPSECEYGHKHVNPKDEKEWCVSSRETPPTEKEWAVMKDL